MLSSDPSIMTEVLGSSKSISGFDPRTVAKCCLWLDSADPSTLFSDATGTTPSTLNGSVAFWRDKSNARANVSNATSAQQPTYTSAGVSYFSLSNSGKGLFGTPPVLNSGGVSAFVVFNPSSLGSGSGRKCMARIYTPGGYIVGFDNIYPEISIPSAYAYQYVLPIIGSNNLMSVVTYNKGVNNNGTTISQLGWDLNFSSSSTSWLFKNDGTNSAENNLAIGSRVGGTFSFDGTISEVIIYDSFLTVSQKQSIQRYLHRKWNITTQPFNPTYISGCVLWNDASTLTGTGAVGTWTNLAGASYTIACTGTKTPNGRNGLTTVNLTTSQTWIPSPDVALGSHSLFWSGRQTGGTNGRVLQGTANNHLYGYWGGYKRAIYNNNSPGQLTTSPSDREWDIFSYTRVAEGAYVFSWNGSVLFSGATSTGSWMDGLRINSGASAEPSDCEIGEIIVYNRILVESGAVDERRMVERYLDAKWNRSLKLPNNFPLDIVGPRLRQFQPTDFKDCYYWVDAAQDTTTLGSTVSILPDWSGSNAPSSGPFGGSITLQANGLNGLPVYNFGTSRSLTSPGFVWNASFTQFAVVQCATGTWLAANLVPANNQYYNYSYAGNDAVYYDTVIQVFDGAMTPISANRSVFEYAAGGKTSWVIFCLGHRSGDSNLTNYTVNGTVLSSTTQTASSITNVGKLVLNGNGANSADTSKVAEFIHYNRSLSDGERQEVEGYLSRKWNIPLPNTSGFLPTSIAGCSTWLDAADSSTTTSIASGIWTDKSGRGGNTTSNAGGGAFSVSNILGIPAVAFPTTAGSAALRIPNNASLTTSTGLSFFMVLNPTSNVGATRFAAANGDTLQFYVTSGANPTSWGLYTPAASFPSPTVTVSNNIPFVYSATIKTDLVQQWSNGFRTDRMSSASSLTISNLTIGNVTTPSSSYSFIGSIGEIIIYSNVVTDVQRKQVELYLTEKWKITAHPFKTVQPTLPDVFTPISLSRCQLWLDGLDPAGTGVYPSVGSTISTWVDKSGSVNNAVGNGNVTYVSNGGVNFDGNAYFLNTSLLMPLANRSVFFVLEEAVHGRGIFLFRQNPTSLTYDYDVASGIPYYTESGRGFSVFTNWYANNRVGYETRFGNTTLLPKAIYNENMNTAVGSGYLNGSNATNNVATAPNTTCSGYLVGTRWWSSAPTGGRFSGVMYEIIAYDRGLTNSERQQVEGYLAWKWNLRSSLPTNHPFYKVSPAPGVRSATLNPDELYLWLDASDLSTLYQTPSIATPVTASGQNVRLWMDKSGIQRNYISILSTFPTFSTKSQVPEVEFDVAGKVLACSYLPAGCRGLDLFIVTRPLTSTADWRTLFRGANNDHQVIIQSGTYNLGAYYSSGGGFFQYGSLTLDGSRRVVLHVSFSTGGAQSASITALGEAYDGTVVMSAASSTNANESFYSLGGFQGGSQPWGYISELLVFRRNLGNQEKIEVFNYLNSKWMTRLTVKNAIDFLPLATNTTNLGTVPQTVTNVGSVTFTTVGGYQCAYFPNSFGTYLRFPYTNPEKFTICFWLRPGDATYYTAISVTNSAISSPALQVDLINSTQLRVFTAMPNDWTNQLTGSSGVNVWTHYAITTNQTNFVQQLYVNGVLSSTQTGSGSALGSRDTFALGRSGDGSRAFFGYMRQFAVFTTVLTEYEIKDIYNASI